MGTGKIRLEQLANFENRVSYNLAAVSIKEASLRDKSPEVTVCY